MGYQSDEEKGPVVPSPSNMKDYRDMIHINTTGQATRSCIEHFAIFFSWLATIIFFPVAVCSSYKTVRQYERAIVFRLGKIEGGPKGPGTFFILSCIDDFHILDLRTVNFDVPPQAVLTKDSVTVGVDAVVYYRVSNPILAIANVANYNYSTRLLASTILRNALGTRKLSDILKEREAIAAEMREALDEATDPWGVKVERIEIKDVRLPDELQRSMAAEAEAARDAKAKLAAAEGEILTARALKEAANALVSSPGALQLRSLQVLGQIATQGGSMIIVPTSITDAFK
ncbi:Erythrocyte band 7 integral membrane protein [Orchesella cincta]|uniref:Erythrocyte band 7 integral membrane protein n=1 Tax=Orchesella cincta TaxID=48709 RepID=A0A1D2MVT3_ORCCI|nr:Erythrocyte band 7 integral membrane protein [Orchesella cincta]